MPYIGNNIRSADDYRLIDDISSSFNGSLTTFALLTAGASPLPFPKSPQQCLISVNGVIQEPDPTGSSGFNLVGTNIVFSSAPTAGHSFFGIIYATADYLNAGGTFPAGSTGSPSITFTTDTDTGIYRRGSGDIGFVSNSTEIVNIDGNGLTVTSKDATINSVNVGKGANSVAGNTVLGELALDAAVTGTDNTAIGNVSATTLTSGGSNTSVGSQSLQLNTTGDKNTAIGFDSLPVNTDSNRNTAVGKGTLTTFNVTDGSNTNNTAVGHDAGNDLTTGTNNTFIGAEAGAKATTSSFESGLSSKPPPIITNFSFSLAKFTKTFAAITGSLDEPIAVGPLNISSMCWYFVSFNAKRVILFLVTLNEQLSLRILFRRSVLSATVRPIQ